MEEARKISKDDVIQITVRKDVVTVRTLDNLNFPIDVWRFERDNLTKNQDTYIANIISMAMSMAMSMASEKDRNEKE